MKRPLVLVKRERDPSSDATKRSLPVVRLEYADLSRHLDRLDDTSPIASNSAAAANPPRLFAYQLSMGDTVFGKAQPQMKWTVRVLLKPAIEM
jgi:hypothetical protein